MTTMSDQGYQVLAARYLGKQLKTLSRQLHGVRADDDIECVHQARVASRRLRAALAMFADCLPSKRVRRWRQAIRRVTKKLGAARDTDVQILFLERVLADLGPEQKRLRPGVERFLLRLRQQRARIQPKVVKVIDRFEKSGVLIEMHLQMEQMLFGLDLRQVELASPAARRRTGFHIQEKLAPLLAQKACLDDPADRDGHHQLRIAAKRLRYTMEVCKPALDGQLVHAIAAAKEMQSALGDIHDCDVWVDRVDAFVVEERERTRTYFGHVRPFARLLPGLEFVRAERHSHRHAAFEQLRQRWRELEEDQQVWPQLVRLLAAAAEPDPAPTVDEAAPADAAANDDNPVREPEP